MATILSIPALRAEFGERLQENVSLARYTSARIGGPADALLTANSADELAETVSRLWELNVTYVILGGGSNVLVSDRGVRGVVVLNRAKDVSFEEGSEPRPGQKRALCLPTWHAAQLPTDCQVWNGLLPSLERLVGLFMVMQVRSVVTWPVVLSRLSC